MRAAARKAFYRTCRAIGRVVPPTLSYWLLLPYSLVRGIRPALHQTNVPIAHVPPLATDRPPGLLARWRFQAGIHQRWLPLLFSDRWTKPPWRDRIRVEGADRLAEIARSRPVVVMTLHTGGLIVLWLWITQHDLGVASVIIDREHWMRPDNVKARTDPRWMTDTKSAVFLAGDTRSMIRFLEPGKCLMLPADAALGRTAVGTWAGGGLTLSVGGFRIARLTDAAVLPVVVMSDGRWRYRVSAISSERSPKDAHPIVGCVRQRGVAA